jgi:transcriptional regulator with XRE-family HTH domain
MGFGKELKRLRESAKISVQKLADKIGVDADRMRKWEQLDYEPRHEDVVKIELFFGMPLASVSGLHSLGDFLKVQNTAEVDGKKAAGAGMVTMPAEDYIARLEKQNQTLESAILLSLNSIQERQAQAKGQLDVVATRVFQMMQVALDEAAEVRAHVQKKEPRAVKAEVNKKLAMGVQVGSKFVVGS